MYSDAQRARIKNGLWLIENVRIESEAQDDDEKYTDMAINALDEIVGDNVTMEEKKCLGKPNESAQ